MTDPDPRNDPPTGDELPDSLLEGGLEALFRSAREGDGHDEETPSVVHFLQARIGGAPNVLLREEDSAQGGEPVVDPSTETAAASRCADGGSRIQVLSEIARGGMGVVLKGRDPDLGRDVAMKVLHEELERDPAMLRRFVEEAQIGGQLQHPGIVPIYELGLLAGERPYFTMKLVKGRTLSSLLDERASLAEDRARFLSIFERVCQTVAYAHARGVVHRDLKPSNVMVGAFGETQIVDWGLSKVLHHGSETRIEEPPPTGRPDADAEHVETVRHQTSKPELDSLVGTVLGTPAYMPPEQARGLIDTLDERSDVFALGALLCSILTGSPPYKGSSAEAHHSAADARLDAAHQRLAASGADGELVELCRSCLEPDMAARPRNAGVVARRIAEYLASVEERARDAQIAAAETRVRARAEKKFLLGMTGAVLAIGFSAVGAYLWFQEQRRERRIETDRVVDGALEEATLLGAQAGASDDLELWVEARRAVESARLLIETRDASPDRERRLIALAANIESEEGSSRERRTRARTNGELLERLREVRRPEENTEPDYSVDWADVARQYEGAFRSAGLELDGLRVEEAAARIDATGVGVELAAALDEWSAAARLAKLELVAERLARIAHASDANDTRRQLREVVARRDVDELRAQLQRPDLAQLPAATLLTFGNALGHAGALEDAVDVLRLANRLHPDDFAVNVQLARWLVLLGPVRGHEALTHFQSALALRPDSVEARHELGLAFQWILGETERSLETYQDGVRRRPDDGHLHFHVGRAQQELGRLDEAITSYREALRHEPGEVRARANLGLALLSNGETEASAAVLREAVARAPRHAESRFNLGCALLELGELDGAVEAFDQARGIRPDFASAHFNLGVVLERQGDLDGAIAAWRETLRVDPEHPGGLRGLGVALSRSGGLEEGLAVLREWVRVEPSNHESHYFLASTLGSSGDVDGAVASFHECLALRPDDAGARYSLGTLLLQNGRFDEAELAFRETLRYAPEHAEAHCNLGLTLLNGGAPAAQALEALRRGHELGSRRADWPYPSADWVREAERRVAEEADEDPGGSPDDI